MLHVPYDTLLEWKTKRERTRIIIINKSRATKLGIKCFNKNLPTQLL